MSKRKEEPEQLPELPEAGQLPVLEVERPGVHRGIPADGTLRTYDSGAVSKATATYNFEPSPVEQYHKTEVDINTIMRRFMGTGEMPQQLREGVYGDFTGVYDYWSALEKIESVDRRFMELPADMREKFDNDPGKLVDYVQSHSDEDFKAFTAPPPKEEPPAA